MREIRLSGSEGGGAAIHSPYPYFPKRHGIWNRPSLTGLRLLRGSVGYYLQVTPTELILVQPLTLKCPNSNGARGLTLLPSCAKWGGSPQRNETFVSSH